MKMKMSAVFTSMTVVFILWVAVLSGCAETSGNGSNVTIPVVQISCTTARCRGVSSASAYIVYTTSSCANSSFGETVAGSTTINCNAFGCVGSVTNFTGAGGLAATQIQEGFYSVCVVLDFNGNYVGDAVAGQDTTGANANSSVNRNTPTKSVNSFTDI